MSDYGFMNGQGFGQESEASLATGAVDEGNLPILILKDKASKTISASFVPAKGVDPFALKFFATFLQRMGHQRITNKSDGEHGLVQLKRKAAQEAGIESVPEESPPGESRSNGEIESAVKEVKGLMRSVKSDLESKLGKPIERSHPILAWLPTYVSDILSRHRVGPDGRTAEKRRTGKNWRRPCFQFGELIMVQLAMPKTQRAARGSYEPAMVQGRYLGHHGRTGALLVMTPEGIHRASGARRLAEEDRWSLEE